MYDVIIKLKIKDSEYTIIHAMEEPILTVSLLTNIIVTFCTINKLRIPFAEYRNIIVTVFYGETDTTFCLKDYGVFPIILRKI